MSVQSIARETVECSHCGGPRVKNDSVEGSFCSRRCYFSHKGQKALNLIKHDHRVCSSCFRPLKVVYRPNEDECYQLRRKSLIIREAFVGFQTNTQYASRGMFGTECKCGTVAHQDTDEICRDGEAYEWFLWRWFQKLHREGQLDAKFSIGTFADSYWEHDNFQMAVGEALFA